MRKVFSNDVRLKDSIFILFTVYIFSASSCKYFKPASEIANDESGKSAPSVEDVNAACKMIPNTVPSRSLSDNEIEQALLQKNKAALADINADLPVFTGYEQILDGLGTIASTQLTIPLPNSALSDYYDKIIAVYRDVYGDLHKGTASAGPLPSSAFTKLFRRYVSLLEDERLTYIDSGTVDSNRSGTASKQYGKHILGRWLSTYVERHSVDPTLKNELDRLTDVKVVPTNYEIVALYMIALYPDNFGLADANVSQKANTMLQNKTLPNLSCASARSKYLAANSGIKWDDLGMSSYPYSIPFTLGLARLRFEKNALVTWVPITSTLFNAAEGIQTFAEGRLANGNPTSAWQRSQAFLEFSWNFFDAVSVYMIAKTGLEVGVIGLQKGATYLETKGPLATQNLAKFTKALRARINVLRGSPNGAREASELIETIESASVKGSVQAEVKLGSALEGATEEARVAAFETRYAAKWDEQIMSSGGVDIPNGTSISLWQEYRENLRSMTAVIKSKFYKLAEAYEQQKGVTLDADALDEFAEDMAAKAAGLSDAKELTSLMGEVSKNDGKKLLGLLDQYIDQNRTRQLLQNRRMNIEMGAARPWELDESLFNNWMETNAQPSLEKIPLEH